MLLRPSARGSAGAPADRGNSESFVVRASGGPRAPDGGKMTYPLLLPMARLLEGIKSSVVRYMQSADSTFSLEDISWALTVPAIWDDEAKAFMVRARRGRGGAARAGGRGCGMLRVGCSGDAVAYSGRLAT
jgi:hypothetical protein